MRFLASIAVVGLLAGCDLGTRTTPAETNWPSVRAADISCFDDPVVHEDHYDLNEDGRDEVFLVMKCKTPEEPPGDQLEVIAGNEDPDSAHPTKLVLQMPDPAVVDRLCFRGGAAIYRVTRAGKAKVWQVKWPKDHAKPGPPTAGPAHGCPE